MFAIDDQTAGPNLMTFLRKPMGIPGVTWAKQIWNFLKFHEQRRALQLKLYMYLYISLYILSMYLRISPLPLRAA